MSFLKKVFKSHQNEPSKPSVPSLTSQGFSVSPQHVHIAQTYANKNDVLRALALKMQQHGFVQGDYLPALQAREAAVSTYLVNGVAIPHGTQEAKQQVVQTGIVVLQIPQGVSWSDTDPPVTLVVGIAAKGDEHLKVLQQLTHVVMDADRVAVLSSTDYAQDIVDALNADTSAGPEPIVTDLAVQASVKVVDLAGMHARPATALATLASQYATARIQVRNGQRVANAKSMAALLTMGAVQGDELKVSAEGDQAQEAVEEIVAAIQGGLDSDDAASHAFYEALDTIQPIANAQCQQRYTGCAAASGIALAPSFVLTQKEAPVVEQMSHRPSEEPNRLQQALVTAHQALQDIAEQMQHTAPQEVAIFHAQQQLLNDETTLAEARALIAQGCTAEWAWQQSMAQQIEALNAVSDERIQARSADMADVSKRVISVLQGVMTQTEFPSSDFILLASDLAPSQTAQLSQTPVRGIATVKGGPNSHMAILARALGLPAIVGIGDDALLTAVDGSTVLLDPQGSQVCLEPDAATQTEARHRIQHWCKLQQQQDANKHEPAETQDGHRIEVVCNIAHPDDAHQVIEQGGEGVGLLRTEFLFEASTTEPSVAEQTDALLSMLADLNERTLVVRTADIGGDKPVSWLPMQPEDNPFLGVRGIRLSFQHEAMFRNQLAAIYLAAKQVSEQGQRCGLHIMFPMIATLEEWRKARDLAEQVRLEQAAPVLPLGIMIEVPSAVLLAEHFAKEVDFFSIGSNDLTQYTLAMDRLHPQLAVQADSFNPALLRMIDMTVNAANRYGKWVGLCGNMAADPDLACLLIGLGVTELSISPANVAAVKHRIRSVRFDALQEKAQRALQLATAAEVKQLYQTASASPS